ncbi:hypothetical protein J4Q44_G00291290, partial [Coregonus suidteri]
CQVILLLHQGHQLLLQLLLLGQSLGQCFTFMNERMLYWMVYTDSLVDRKNRVAW